MKVKTFLEKVAYIDDMKIGDDVSKVYKSKFDDSYITHVGMENSIKYLADREITDNLTHGVGFSPKDNKWYGWSHRAIYGFEIGSECKKGDCHYVGSSLDEQEEAAVRFWTDEHHENVRCEGIIEENGNRYFDIKWDYKNTVGGSKHYIPPLGRGELTAKTMEDAKQMAVDFNE